MDRTLLWFRTDLRLHDHAALQLALDQSSEIIPVYIFNDQWFQKDRWGFDRTGPFRVRFILESIADLRRQLRDSGNDLLVMQGRPELLLPELAKKYGCNSVCCSKEYTTEEIEIERKLEAQMNVFYAHNSTLLHPADLPFSIDQLPKVFTAFRKKVEKYSSVRSPFPRPKHIPGPKLQTDSLPEPEAFGIVGRDPDSRGVLPFEGGETAAWNRIQHYFYDTRHLSEYKETRNGMIGPDYSSKFSPWLAQGCISPRAIYEEVERYEQEIEKNQSTYWLKFELLWRDFFKFTAMRYGNKIFLPGGIQNLSKQWSYDPDIVQRWIDGKTGDDFVDANMNELRLTGFMSNRGRQNVASFLVHQLKQDWRAGGAWFESQLIDYDVTSNYGNWIYAAGVGNDPRDRVFNTQKQADRYDPDGMYRRRWL